MTTELMAAWQRTVRRRNNDRAVSEALSGQSVTFGELAMRARAWLADHGGDLARLRRRLVVFAAPNGMAWFAQFVGLMEAGAVVVPLDAAEPVAGQRELAAALGAGFWWDGRRLIALPGAKRERSTEVCLIKMTSGTTTAPRPLRFTGGQLLADARQVTHTMGVTARDLNYALIPLGHSYGLGNLTIPLLAQGVPLVCGASALPHAIAADFARWRPTVFPGVPAMWRALSGSDLTLDSLRLAISAGADLPPEVARQFAERFSCPLHNFYGSSETGGIAYDRSGRATLAGRVGKALRGVTLKQLPRSRLVVSSSAVVTFGRRPTLHGPNAWVMADRVLLSPEGEVTLLGRRGATVKIGARRVSLTEVVARLRRLPGVKDAWVGITSGSEPVLGAVVATKSTAAALRQGLHADTAPWKIPKKFVVVTDLPLNERGKPDTRALQAMIT